MVRVRGRFILFTAEHATSFRNGFMRVAKHIFSLSSFTAIAAIMTTRMLSALSLGLPAMLLSACAATSDKMAETPVTNAGPVTVRIVGLNDFHGNIEPIRRAIKVTDDAGDTQELHAGGAAYLASAVAQYRQGGDFSMVIAAGDLIGGSPLASSIFLDEPAIGAMNRIGLDYNAVGNHEFDRGWRELKRIANGGCEKFTARVPCAVEPDFGGAEFAFLAANVVQADGSTLFPGYGLTRLGKGRDGTGNQVTVGVIGLTLKDTPTLVTPSGVAGLDFTDEAEAINALIPRIEADGADAIVVTIHQGLYTEVGYNDKGCGGVSGPLIDILKRVDPKVDLVISGHTHRAYVCDFGTIDPQRPFLVTSAGYGGSMLTAIDLVIDPNTRDVTAKSANNIVVQSIGEDSDGNDAAPNTAFTQYMPDPDIAAYVAQYVDASREAAQRPVGRISAEARDPGPATEETALGNLIADAQLASTRDVGAQIALMNNSGIRTGLLPLADGTISYGDIYAVQPFGNTLVTKSFTGTQLLALLEQQLDDEGFVQTFSVSDGFAFTYDMARPVGSRIVDATLNDTRIDQAASYRVTMNSFLAAGGDGFTIFEEGTDVVTGPVDLDSMEAWLTIVPVRTLPETGRVTAIER